MRERFIPRLLEAEPERPARSTIGDNLDPHRIWATMMTNEKPGGHGERSVAVGTLDMAVWDAVAKIEQQAAVPSAGRALRQRHADQRVFVYAAGGYYQPGQGPRRASGRDARLPRPRLHRGQDEDRRRVRSHEDHRADRSGARDARAAGSGWRSTPTAGSTCDTAIAYAAGALAPTTSSGTRRPATRSTTQLQARRRGGAMPSPLATGENLFSMQDARNLIRYGGLRPERDWLQFDCASQLRPRRVPAHPRDARRERLVAVALCSARRSPDVAEHRGRARPRRERVVSRPLPAVRRVPRRRAVEDSHVTMPDLPGIGFEGKAISSR